MTERQLLEEIVAINTLQLQVLLEIRKLLASQSGTAQAEFEFPIRDVADHVSVQRDRILSRLQQEPD